MFANDLVISRFKFFGDACSSSHFFCKYNLTHRCTIDQSVQSLMEKSDVPLKKKGPQKQFCRLLGEALMTLQDPL